MLILYPYAHNQASEGRQQPRNRKIKVRNFAPLLVLILLLTEYPLNPEDLHARTHTSQSHCIPILPHCTHTP